MLPIRISEVKSRVLAAVFAVFFTLPQLGGAAVINFDDVGEGTAINTHYPGVTFSNPLNAASNIFARSSASFAPSSPNVVSVFGPPALPTYDARNGAVDATLATPVGFVSIDARPVAPFEFLTPLTRRPYLEAYTSSGALIGQVYYQGALPNTVAGVGPTETLSFTSTANNIARVRFSVQNPGSPPTVPPTYGLFDNLNFSRIFSLTANTSGSGSVRRTPDQSQYIDGTLVTLSAEAPAGWKFSHWSGDVSSTANPLQVAMTADKVLVANFVPASPTPAASRCLDFNSGVPSGVTLFGDARVDGGRLKLYTVGQPNSFGIAYIDDFNAGAPVASFRASFKAALFGSTCCIGGLAPADGFSFNLVPAATAPANPGYGEPAEEGSDAGLAVNFDTWDNGIGEAPAIDVKWLGRIIASAPFQSSQSPNGIVDPALATREVVINLDPDGTIDVSYGGTLVLSNVQTPYRASTIGAPKWIFGARVGAANDNHWLDDVCISTVAGGQWCNDFNSGVPAGTTLFGDARVDAGRLKLYTVGDQPGFGIAYFDDFSQGQFVKAFRVTFKAALFGSTCCGIFPADGFSFNLVPAATVRSNPGYGEPAEEGLEEGLAVNFDTWDNSIGEAPAIEIKWRGQIVASAPFQSSQSPAGITDPGAAEREVVIELKADGHMDVVYGGTVVLNNVQTPYDAAAIGAPKWVLGARVGGANDNHWFDDLCITTLTTPGWPIPGLYSTGVDDAGRPLLEDAVDSHYRLTFGGTTAYVATEVGGFPIPPWLGTNSMSAWIGPAPDTIGLSDGTGTYNYRYETTFNLGALAVSGARIAGRWACDNRGVDILINGVGTGQSNDNQFNQWTPFVINSGFVAGANRLTFVVNNGSPGAAAGSDPTGLRVELWGEAALQCGSVRPAPTVRIARQGATALVSWSDTGYVLQGAGSVTGPWQDLTRGVTVNGLDHQAAFPAGLPQRYFRLRSACE